MKKILIQLAILVIAFIVIMFVSVPWTKAIEAKKWGKFYVRNHCTPIEGNQHQCDIGVVTKP